MDRRRLLSALASTTGLGLLSGCADLELPGDEVPVDAESPGTGQATTDTRTTTQPAPEGPIRITSYEGDDTRPSWSPDGSAIAYLRVKPDPGPTGRAADIGRVDPDGSNEAVWIEGPASGFGVGGPSPLHWLSGTGGLLAYEAVGGHEVMEIDTTKTPFARTASTGDDEAFTRKMYVPGGGGAVINSVSLDGSTIIWLSRDSSGSFTTRVASYSSLDGQATDAHGRVLFGPSGSTTDRGAALVFDGSAFVVSRPAGSGFDLSLHATDTGEEMVRLTTSGETDGVLNIEPAVSFERERVAFASGTSFQGSFGLHTIDLYGEQPARAIVSGDEVNAHNPSWSPDGTRLVFQGRDSTNADAAWNLYTVQLGQADDGGASSPTPTHTPSATLTPTTTPTSTATSTPSQPREESKLAANDGDDLDFFGAAVVIDGDTAVIGARGDEDPHGFEAGSAYVFDRSAGSWSQQAKLVARDGDSEDSFGHDVAIDGDTAVVGSPDDEHPNGGRAGSAYVFTRSGTSWSQQAKLAAIDGDVDDRFGTAVAVVGDTVVVGAPDDDHSRGSDGGAAYVFTRSGSNWHQQAKLIASDGDDDDGLGVAVAVDGDTAVLGARADENPYEPWGGSAYVFARSGSGWHQQAKLVADDGDDSDFFGWSVAVDGDTAVVGSARDEDPHGRSAGSAYVFARSGSNWHQRAKLIAGDGDDGDFFGETVAIDGDTVIIGARGDEDPHGAGSAYVYTRSAGNWRQHAKLVPSDWGGSPIFGKSVAVDGGTAVIGAYRDQDPNGGGSAYVFEI